MLSPTAFIITGLAPTPQPLTASPWQTDLSLYEPARSHILDLHQQGRHHHQYFASLNTWRQAPDHVHAVSSSCTRRRPQPIVWRESLHQPRFGATLSHRNRAEFKMFMGARGHAGQRGHEHGNLVFTRQLRHVCLLVYRGLRRTVVVCPSLDYHDYKKHPS